MTVRTVAWFCILHCFKAKTQVSWLSIPSDITHVYPIHDLCSSRKMSSNFIEYFCKIRDKYNAVWRRVKSFPHIRIFSQGFFLSERYPPNIPIWLKHCMNLLILFRDFGEQDMHYFDFPPFWDDNIYLPSKDTSIFSSAIYLTFSIQIFAF